MRERSLKARVGVVTLLWLALWQPFSLAETILYPGSFNPFHRTHFEEVENALSFNPGSTVTILPIEEAVYTKDEAHQPLRVRLFSFPLEMSFIHKSFEANNRVHTSEDLRVISGDPVESLLNFSKSLSDPDVSILVGPDVVEKWSQSPKFSALITRVKLLVTTDPKNAGLSTALKNQFQSNQKVVFVDLPSSGIRGGEVRTSVISRSHSLYKLLPPKLGDYLKDHPNILQEAIGNYQKRLFIFLEKDLQRNILPTLMENGLPQKLGAFFLKNPSLAFPLLTINPEDSVSVAHAAEKLRSHLPPHLRQEEAQTLISDLVVATQKLPVQELLNSRNRTSEHRLYQILHGSSQPSPRSNKSHRNSVFSDPFGTWNGGLTDLMRPLTQLDISDSPEVTALAQKEKPGFLEVYRGIKNRKEIDALVDEILKSGFVSKVALNSLKRGASDGGLSASEQDLFRRGIQSAILEHVFGDYHTTSPFVATTLDRKIAEGFAGKGGFVFKIRTPVQKGYFLNELVFWKNTPWEKEGNPFHHLNEFIIPHRIEPEQIVEARKVIEDTLPLPEVPLIQRAKALKIVPFKLKTSLQKTTEQFCSRILQTLAPSHSPRN